MVWEPYLIDREPSMVLSVISLLRLSSPPVTVAVVPLMLVPSELETEYCALLASCDTPLMTTSLVPLPVADTSPA